MPKKDAEEIVNTVKVSKADSPLRPPKKKQNGIGIKGARRPNAPMIATWTPAEAAENCDLFPRGREAFVQWMESTYAIGPRTKLPISDWTPYLETFSARPIHGFRRTQTRRNR